MVPLLPSLPLYIAVLVYVLYLPIYVHTHDQHTALANIKLVLSVFWTYHQLCTDVWLVVLMGS